jgi:hypothetical protein
VAGIEVRWGAGEAHRRAAMVVALSRKSRQRMAPALSGRCRWTRRGVGEVWGASGGRFLTGGRKQGGGVLGGSPSERERGAGEMGPGTTCAQVGKKRGGVPHGGCEGRGLAPTSGQRPTSSAPAATRVGKRHLDRGVRLLTPGPKETVRGSMV